MRLHEHTAMNYPVASKAALKKLKDRETLRVESNELRFLSNKTMCVSMDSRDLVNKHFIRDKSFDPVRKSSLLADD